MDLHLRNTVNDYAHAIKSSAAAETAGRLFHDAYDGLSNLRARKSTPEARTDLPSQPGDHLRSISVDGVKRDFIVHVPPGYDGTKKLPVVYFFHNLFGSGKGVSEFTAMTKKADSEGFIVVYPNATGWAKNFLRSWNVGGLSVYRNDDLKFVETLMNTIDQKMAVDKSRVYVAGFSNGGMMAHEVAARFSSRIAAMASVSGCMTGRETTPSEPVAALIIHGTKDRLVPFDGRRWQTRLGLPEMKSVTFARDFWTKHNRTTSSTCEDVKPGITRETHTGDRGCGSVVRYTIRGARHGYPGSNGWSIDGPICQELNATDIMWNFFSKHKR